LNYKALLRGLRNQDAARGCHGARRGQTRAAGTATAAAAAERILEEHIIGGRIVKEICCAENALLPGNPTG